MENEGWDRCLKQALQNGKSDASMIISISWNPHLQSLFVVSMIRTMLFVICTGDFKTNKCYNTKGNTVLYIILQWHFKNNFLIEFK